MFFTILFLFHFSFNPILPFSLCHLLYLYLIIFLFLKLWLQKLWKKLSWVLYGKKMSWDGGKIGSGRGIGESLTWKKMSFFPTPTTFPNPTFALSTPRFWNHSAHFPPFSLFYFLFLFNINLSLLITLIKC